MRLSEPKATCNGRSFGAVGRFLRLLEKMNFRLLILMIAVLAWPLGTSKPAQSSEAWSYSVRQSSTRAPDRSAFERRVAAEKELNKKFVLILKLNDQQI